uniref:Leucine-rich repeat LGI family, member 2a n=1 Tax=Fundulus heteroclitus TaxID=8078 RepID=A0A3Q2Q239_FUNHE
KPNLTHASPTGRMPPALRIWALLCVSLCCLCQPALLKKPFRCPSTCSCSKESIICVGSSNIPRIAPNEITSFFSLNVLHIHALELFSRSLANNNIQFLPRDLFIDLDSLIELDLRGNAFECDCRAKWLMMWLKSTNATVSDVVCAGPEDMKGKRLNDMSSLHNECISTDFVLHQSVAAESLSVDTFTFKNDVYVTISAPSTDSCMVLQWDHIEMNFRTYDNITGKEISSGN